MSEDTIINLLAGGTLLFAVVLSILIKITKAIPGINTYISC